jgi:hypothetical protein
MAKPNDSWYNYPHVKIYDEICPYATYTCRRGLGDCPVRGLAGFDTFIKQHYRALECPYIAVKLSQKEFETREAIEPKKELFITKPRNIDEGGLNE